ncbi:PEP-CTERM sorting domain-containing protein [Nitrosomonas sp.]|uniref:PEP-CTERM sorting domain-containing protein n=1 Tax=Nitrosomonas sp. TaxID=42353 RepID=UPI0032EEA395
MLLRSVLSKFLACALLFYATTISATVVNIDATRYGFAFPTDPAPVIGQIINPFSTSGPLNQLTLSAGTYTITNANGLPGANPDFTALRFNDMGGSNWAWGFVIADDSDKRVVLYGEAGGLSNTKSGIADQLSVQNFVSTLYLPTTTTLDFMIRDYYLADNAGGVALNITAVPEPEAYVMLLAGLSWLGFMARQRKELAM